MRSKDDNAGMVINDGMGLTSIYHGGVQVDFMDMDNEGQLALGIT